MSKKTILSIVGGLLLIGLVTLISKYMISHSPQPPTDSMHKTELFVKAEPVKYEPINASASYPGRVNSYENVALSAEVTGKIMTGSVPFKTGQTFSKGDLLVKIFSEDTEASLKARKSSFLQTLSSILPDLKIDFPERYETWRSFFAQIDINHQLPELPEISSDKERVFMASKGVLTEYYTIQQYDINLKKYTIYAPFNGYLKSVNKQVGAIATTGQELATIVNSDRLEVQVPVSVADAARINTGQTVTLISRKGNEYTGKVARVANFIDEATQSVNVYITYIPQSKAPLLEGEFVNADFAFENSIVGFVIPREAVFNQTFVNMVKNEKVIATQVNILQTLNDAFIINGLTEGDTIVTESLMSINKKTIIKVR